MPVNVPAENSDDDFEFLCSCLNGIIGDSIVAGFIFGRDLNFRLKSTRHSFIINSLYDYNAILADEIYLDSHSFTFISDCHNTASWLDHVIVNRQLMYTLNCFWIQYGLTASDNRPISFIFNAFTSLYNVTEKNETVLVSNWDACTGIELNDLAHCMNSLLQQVTLPSIFHMHKCENKRYREDISQYLDKILQCIGIAKDTCIPSKRCSSAHYTVAGWNDLVSERHTVARSAF
jgi:hypothetical protein